MSGLSTQRRPVGAGDRSSNRLRGRGDVRIGTDAIMVLTRAR